MTISQLAPLLPLKRLATIRSSNVDKVVEDNEISIRLCNYVDVYYNDQIHPALEFAAGSAKQSEIDRFGLRPGDVLITKDSETPDDIAVPSLVVQGADDLVCGYHLALLRPNPSRLNGTFLFYALKSQSIQAAFSILAQGITRFGLTLSGIGSVPVPLPDLPTQKAIADFLDRETAHIDQLIEKKQRMVGVLGEKRQAVISHVVTKGLEPDVRMKDSGVEWLGDIPAHWEVKQLRRAIMFQRGHDLPTDEREEGDVAIVSSSGISSTHSRAVAKAPGIVTGRYGTIGQFHLICQDYWPLNTTLYSIDFCGNDPRFLLYMLVHMSPLFLAHAVKSAVPGVDRNDVHADATVVPPISDQRAIAASLDEETANIDSLVAKVRQSIGRLREFRSALITAAVTGQIDVSTWGKQETTSRRLDQIEETKSA